MANEHATAPLDKAAIAQLKANTAAWHATAKNERDALRAKYDAALEKHKEKLKVGKPSLPPDTAALERHKQMIHHLEELEVRAQQLETAHGFSDGTEE
jgi:ElaB/YqjD/DUF883 family membrane-anchored ribosome-binding protein